MDLIATLPWWAGIALALTSYMVLHSIAIRPSPCESIHSATDSGN